MRLLWARIRLRKVQSKYRIVFEDPANPDIPAKIVVPDPNWMAAAIAGGFLPPIGAYLQDRESDPGTRKLHPYAPPIGPMTEEQAIEYLTLLIVPRHVIEYRGNREILKIVPVETIPTDRTYRQAWVIKQGVMA